MSIEANKAIVLHFYEDMFNRKDLATLDELIAPHAVDHSAPAGAPGGIEEVRQWASNMLAHCLTYTLWLRI